MRSNEEILINYLPEEAIAVVNDWISDYNIFLQIKGNRSTKHGDYYPPVRNNYHKITINNSLNKYSFLITFVHEVAHLMVWLKHKDRVKPHGKEWKNEFRILMATFLNLKVFPEDIKIALNKYLDNAKASTTSDLVLSRILRKYDKNTQSLILENIPDRSDFMLKNGRRFRKEGRLRKRYRCICLKTNRIYFIHPLVEVIPIK